MTFLEVFMLLFLFFVMALVSAFIYLLIKSKLDQVARAALVDKTITSVIGVIRDIKSKGVNNV